MTLDATKPTDQVLVSELPAYIRENRVAMNAFESGDAEYTTTEITLASGTTTLALGTNLADVDFEVVMLTALGACTLETITGGTAGQIKVIIFRDNNVTIQDGVKSDGKFYLNQLPALGTYSAQKNDSLALVNILGDGSSNNGYWKEFQRQPSVK